MRTYKISVPYSDDGERNHYARLYPKDHRQFRASLSTGDPIEMFPELCDGIPVGDFLGVPFLGFGMKRDLADELVAISPGARLIPLVIPTLEGEFVLFKPHNYLAWGEGMGHMFMMFDVYKKVVVTDVVKAWWDRRGLKGVLFDQVAEIDDSLFVEAPAAWS